MKTQPKAPRIGASDMVERVRAEMIQIGNRVPAARREIDDLEPLVAKIGHYYDGIIEPLRAVFEETALALGCLPSTFEDANGHVVERAKVLAEENRALKTRVDFYRSTAMANAEAAVVAKERIAALEAEVDRKRADFRDMTALAGVRERERDAARAEVERLKATLQRIDGGDNPCTDERQLRQWAYEALTLGK